ncbi:putative opsin-5-like [Scophthalmus maximus]|uniref:Opsin-5 n=1 Tax=Scophthalmus maximus TaxID=52904 RepID=A0A2U9CUB4_SCOMX|nr:putative opsin-5-like [Scophthalmus maximus]
MSGNSSARNRTASAFVSKLTPAADICVGLAILCVVLLSVLGNGLVLVVCYRRRKTMVASELLCVNLAVIDFLCCICFYPLSILSSFRHGWLGEHATCVYYGLGCFVFGLCGMFTITAISVTRYLKTCSGAAYALRLEGATIRAACCAIWLVATAWSCLPLFGWGAYAPEPYGLSCTVAWRGYHTSAKDAFYVICSFACFTLVPVLLIAVSQWRILCKVSRFSNSLSARGIRSNLRHTEKRLSVMFFCISLGFVIAWAPYAVVSFLLIFDEDPWYMAPEGFVFPALFAKSSHVYNPFIYFYFNKSFQRELRCLLLSVWPSLGGNRVGARSSAAEPQAQLPIHIQLQEQGCRRKKAAGPPHDRTHTKTKSKGEGTRAGGNRGAPVRPVYHCWGSTSKNPHMSSGDKPAKDGAPVSI